MNLKPLLSRIWVVFELGFCIAISPVIFVTTGISSPVMTLVLYLTEQRDSKPVLANPMMTGRAVGGSAYFLKGFWHGLKKSHLE